MNNTIKKITLLGMFLVSAPQALGAGISNGNVDGWDMVWNDEFDGENIDLSKWQHEINCDGGGNHERQCYTDSPENSFIEDGILKIVAKPETGQELPFSSARLMTKNQGEWKYGRFEIRAKAPSGQGSWPAIWMLPTDWVYGSWPHSGEIDIFESVNLGVPLDGGGVESNIHGTLHYGQGWPNNSHSGQSYLLPNGASPTDDFHTYTVEWEEGEIRWYVDGYLYQTQLKSTINIDEDDDANGLLHRGWFTEVDGKNQWNNAPYDQEFRLLLNFAVGGDWPEAVNQKGVDANAFSAENTFEIDYVRVYQCNVEPATGKGCATVHADYLNPVNEGGTLINGKAPVPIKPSTGIATDLNVFVDALNDHWPAWDCCADSIATIKTDDVDHDQVVEFTIGANPTVVGFNTTVASSPAPYDGSPMVDTGVLEFDLKLVSAPNNASAAWNLKVEQAGATSEAVITIATPTAEWQHYAIPLKTLRNAGLGLNGIDVIMIFPDWGKGEGAVFRVDNLTILAGDVPPPANTTNISVDFENADDSYVFENFDGGVSVVVANPDSSGINTSAKVVQMQKYAGQPWGGSALSLANAIDIVGGTTVTMKVWSDRPVSVLFKLEGMNKERSVEHSGTGWEELSFDFSGETGVNVTAVTLIFDLDTLGNADSDAQNWTFYYDDIVLSSSSDDNSTPADDEFVLISSSQASDIAFGANTVGEWSTGSQITSDVIYQQRLAWGISSSSNTAAQGNWGTVLAFQDGIIGDFSEFTRLKLKLATTGGYSDYKLYISANGVSHVITLPIDDNDNAWQHISINTVDIPLSLSAIDSMVVYATGGLPGISKIYLTDFSLLQHNDVIFNDAVENDFVFISSDNSISNDLIVDNDDNSADGNVIFGEWSTDTTLSNTHYAGLNAMQLTAGGSWGAVLALQGDISDGVNIDNFDVDLANYTNIKFKMASQGAFAKYALAIVSKIGDNEVSQEIEFSLANPSNWNNIDIDLDMFGVNLSHVSQMALFGAYDGGSATQQIYITDLIAYDTGRTITKTSSDDKFVFFSSSGEQSDMVFDGNDLTHDGNITIGEWSTGTVISQGVTYQALSSVELTKGSWGAVLALMGDVYGGVKQYSFDVAQYQNINFKIATTGSFSDYTLALIANGAEFKVPLTVTSDWTEVSIDVSEVPVDLSKLTQMVIYAAGGAAGDKFYVTDLNIATDRNSTVTSN